MEKKTIKRCIECDHKLEKDEEVFCSVCGNYFREIQEYTLEEMYDTYLDQDHGDVNICGISYPTSIAFKHIDEIAYNVHFNEWLDSQMESKDIIEHEGRYYHRYA